MGYRQHLVRSVLAIRPFSGPPRTVVGSRSTSRRENFPPAELGNFGADIFSEVTDHRSGVKLTGAVRLDPTISWRTIITPNSTAREPEGRIDRRCALFDYGRTEKGNRKHVDT